MSADNEPPSKPEELKSTSQPEAKPADRQRSVESEAAAPRTGSAATAATPADSHAGRPSGAKGDHISTGEADKKAAEEKKKKSHQAIAIAFGIIGGIIAFLVFVGYVTSGRKKLHDLSEKDKEKLT